MSPLIWSRTCYGTVEGKGNLGKKGTFLGENSYYFRSSMADNNFQLRVRKRSRGISLPSAESNFQLRVRKDFLDRIRESPHIRSSAENNFQLRVRRGPSHAERNFQLRVRKSDPEMYQREARQTLLEKIRDRRFGQRMADNNFQLRVRRSPESTQT